MIARPVDGLVDRCWDIYRLIHRYWRRNWFVLVPCIPSIGPIPAIGPTPATAPSVLVVAFYRFGLRLGLGFWWNKFGLGLGLGLASSSSSSSSSPSSSRSWSRCWVTCRRRSPLLDANRASSGTFSW